MWNPLKKAKDSISIGAVKMMQAAAMKKIEKMGTKERQKMIQEAMNPKNKDKMLAVMEQMKKAGQISETQYQMAKEKLGM